MLFITLFTSRIFGQNELKGIWKGDLAILEFSNEKWSFVNASGFVEMDFDSLTAKYFVGGYGVKIFSFKTIEDNNLFGNKIIIYLPEFGLYETTLNVQRKDNDYIFASGATRTAPPFLAIYLKIKKVN